jgi:hypothetical protein
VGGVDDRPDYDYADGVTLRLYQIPDGARVTTVLSPGGPAFVTTRAGNMIRVTAATVGDTGGDWQAWHAGRIIRGHSGTAEFTVLPGAASRNRINQNLLAERFAVSRPQPLTRVSVACDSHHGTVRTDPGFAAASADRRRVLSWCDERRWPAQTGQYSFGIRRARK